MKIIENGTVTSPIGYLGVGCYIGIKKAKKDLAMIVSQVPAKCVGTFTTNVVKAAPVVWDKNIVDNYSTAKVIAINSGVANACTGVAGELNNQRFARLVAENMGLDEHEVLICSTGVIGKQLPMDIIEAGLPKAIDLLSESDQAGIDVATAIMTTDTKPKHMAIEVSLSGKTVTLGCCAKGSGMIHPNMATMLGFITTDCNISKTVLDAMVKEVVNETFNMISVDRDTSTNDTVLCMANSLAHNPEIVGPGHDYDLFKEALSIICTYLAKAIAGDGEGATKLLEVDVVNCSSKENAKIIAKSICTSPLVKTAMFGNDANWGRLFCAMGYAGVDFDDTIVDIYLQSNGQKIKLVEKGMATDYSEEKATEIIDNEKVNVLVDMHEGDQEARAWGCDLSYDYVKINADYRS